MGIVESRILASNLLSACNKAVEEEKHRLDKSQFWGDTVSSSDPLSEALILIKVGKHQSIEKHI
jgi:hypothetical protein